MFSALHCYIFLPSFSVINNTYAMYNVTVSPSDPSFNLVQWWNISTATMSEVAHLQAIFFQALLQSVVQNDGEDQKYTSSMSFTKCGDGSEVGG